LLEDNVFSFRGFPKIGQHPNEFPNGQNFLSLNYHGIENSNGKIRFQGKIEDFNHLLKNPDSSMTGISGSGLITRVNNSYCLYAIVSGFSYESGDFCLLTATPISIINNHSLEFFQPDVKKLIERINEIHVLTIKLLIENAIESLDSIILKKTELNEKISFFDVSLSCHNHEDDVIISFAFYIK